MSDIELLKAWRAGDDVAGSRLFERHFSAIYRFFASKVESGVEDLVQETFLGCVKTRDRIRNESGFRAYLFGIARHALYRALRGRYRGRDDLDFSITSLQDLNPSPSALAAQREEESIVTQGLRRLSIEQQLTIELHYFEGLSATELATVLDVPLGTAKSRLRRAKEALRRAVDELSEASNPCDRPSQGLQTWSRLLRLARESHRTA